MRVGGLESREGPSALGAWQGQSRTRHRCGTWRHRTPSWGEGVRTPEAGWDGQACGDLVSTRGSFGPPWGVRVCGSHPSAPPLWVRGGPGSVSARRRSGDHDPSCQAWAACHVTQKARERLRITLHSSGWSPYQESIFPCEATARR
jgi:hypothetical protein